MFHVVNPTFKGPDLPFAEIPGSYRLVAEVRTCNLDKAFALTNNTEQDWSLNRGVRAFVDPCRSTSVGDVIVTPDDEAYIVLSKGFRSLGKV